MVYEFTFENPNSLNNHWVKSKHGVYLSVKGREFRSHVIKVVTDAGHYNLKLTGRLKYSAVYYPPDSRKRDLDNFCSKAVFDALTHAGLYEDDCQIDDVHYTRGEKQADKVAKIKIKIEEIDEELED